MCIRDREKEEEEEEEEEEPGRRSVLALAAAGCRWLPPPGASNGHRWGPGPPRGPQRRPKP
eukprot:2037376-Pyramimonas_sp.AAC.1